MEKNEISEEVTITPIIRDLERLFSRLFRFIIKLVQWTFEGVKNFFLFAFRNFILLFIITLLGGFLGFFSTQFIPKQYTSSMVVKLNVDSKEQLMNDIAYVNALIEKGEQEDLATLFLITSQEAATLTGCQVYSFSNYVEKTVALNELYQNTDTALYSRLNTDELMNNSNSDLSSKFKIAINATDQTVFSKLEKPLLVYLERVTALRKLLESSQKALVYQREIYEGEMTKLDTLSMVMNQAMIERAKTSGQSSSNTYVLLGEERGRSDINALDLQDRYIFYAQKISKIDVAIQEHKTLYFVNSHLNPFGQKMGYDRLSRAVFLALIFFSITYLILILFKSSKKSV